MSTNMSASLILHLGLVQTDMSLYDIIYLVTQTFIFIKIFCRDLQHVLPFNYDTPVAQWNIISQFVNIVAEEESKTTLFSHNSSTS